MKGLYITIIGRSSVRDKLMSCLIFFCYYLFKESKFLTMRVSELFTIISLDSNSFGINTIIM